MNGAQGNFPFNQAAPKLILPQPRIPADLLFLFSRAMYAMPWLDPDPIDRQRSMSPEQLSAMFAGIPPGVIRRHQSSPFSPVQVPDLIGIKDRHYLDHTGLQRHSWVVDLMRYAALNQGADSLASYDGLFPRTFPISKNSPIPPIQVSVGGRYRDEQLYALALYIYSLKPPSRPE